MKLGGTVEATFQTIGRYYHHAGSGLELALYRAYDPELGRWLNEDPLEEEGGLNMYAYVADAPTFKFDPDGREWVNWTGTKGLDTYAKTRQNSGTPDVLNVITHGHSKIIDSPWGTLTPEMFVKLIDKIYGKDKFVQINFYSCNSASTAYNELIDSQVWLTSPAVPISYADRVAKLTGHLTSGFDSFIYFPSDHNDPKYPDKAGTYRKCPEGQEWVPGQRLHYNSNGLYRIGTEYIMTRIR